MKVKAIVEIPMGSAYKYEISKLTGGLHIDRVLNQKLPENYGFIQNTSADDGCAIGVFILSTEPIPPLTRVEVEIYGIIKCKDNGIQDDKILACLVGDLGSKFPKQRDILVELYLKTYKPGFVVERKGTLEEAEASCLLGAKAFTVWWDK